MQTLMDDIPIYIPNTIPGKTPIILTWIPRSTIAFYNVHVNLDSGVFRVGEAQAQGSKAYIFDRAGFQWGEYQQIPEVLSR